jgi:hypothetical protein
LKQGVVRPLMRSVHFWFSRQFHVCFQVDVVGGSSRLPRQ